MNDEQDFTTGNEIKLASQWNIIDKVGARQVRTLNEPQIQ